MHSMGLRPGEEVRFRKPTGGRWLPARMHRVDPDGSLLLYDADGAARNIRPEQVEVRRPNGRGRLSWQVVSDVAVTWEQLALWEEPPTPTRPRRRR